MELFFEHLLHPTVFAELQLANTLPFETYVARQFFFHAANHALGREWLSAIKALKWLFFVQNPSRHSRIGIGQQSRAQSNRIFRASVFAQSALHAIPFNKRKTWSFSFCYPIVPAGQTATHPCAKRALGRINLHLAHRTAFWQRDLCRRLLPLGSTR